MTTPTMPDTMTLLTADDISAMRIADTAVFRHYRGVATIEVTIQRRAPRYFTALEQRLFDESRDNDERRRVITVEGTIGGYEGDSQWRSHERSSAFTMIHSAQYDHPWVYWSRMLVRAGDHLLLRFLGDQHSNGNTKPHGIHVDALHVEIKRTGAKVPMVFPMDVSACYENSARMVRRYGS